MQKLCKQIFRHLTCNLHSFEDHSVSYHNGYQKQRDPELIIKFKTLKKSKRLPHIGEQHWDALLTS